MHVYMYAYTVHYWYYAYILYTCSLQCVSMNDWVCVFVPFFLTHTVYTMYIHLHVILYALSPLSVTAASPAEVLSSSPESNLPHSQSRGPLCAGAALSPGGTVWAGTQLSTSTSGGIYRGTSVVGTPLRLVRCPDWWGVLIGEVS